MQKKGSSERQWEETKRSRRGILRLDLLQLTSVVPHRPPRSILFRHSSSLAAACTRLHSLSSPARALPSGPPSFVALASTYQDFLKPAPQDGWDQLNK